MLFNRKSGFLGGGSPRKSGAARRGIAALGIVGLLLLSLTAVASADTAAVRFSAAAPVTGIGLDVANGGGTQSEFTVTGNGKIKKVVVNTTGEIIEAGPVFVTNCVAKQGGAAFCNSLAESGMLSLHDSSATLMNPDIVLVDIGNGIEQEQLAGNLKGHLDSKFAIKQPNGQLLGKARLRIDGQGAYGCYTLAYVPEINPAAPIFWPETAIAVCQGQAAPTAPGNVLAAPMLLPTALQVDDNGHFMIKQATGVFSNIKEVKGHVNVGLAAVGGSILGGYINITNGLALVTTDEGD